MTIDYVTLVFFTWFHHVLPPVKGGDPAADSPTATLFRLNCDHQKNLLPVQPTFGLFQLSQLDGRCVQDQRTYSPRLADSRLLAIPTSWSRISDSNLNWDQFFGISSVSRLGDPLYWPL